MEDSLSLLEKEMNRMSLKNPVTMIGCSKEVGSLKGNNFCSKTGK